GRPERMRAAEFERALYLARNVIERRWAAAGIGDAYIPSLSHHTVVYKGMFIAPQLPRFYADLRDPLFETALAVFHQRYSTNTFPSWPLAQPFRLLAHNGEINTLWGNANWMRAREGALRSGLWRDRMRDLLPVIRPGGSDSAMLDNVLDLVVQSGRDLLHAMMMLVPEAWENAADMPEPLRAFYQFHAGLTEPWDGPADLAFTDGRVAAAALDRNGLRPARYTITDDGLVIVASEVGVIDVDPERVVEKGRLGPGRMIAVDTAAGRILTDKVIKAERAWRRPYTAWVSAGRVPLEAAARGDGPPPAAAGGTAPIGSAASPGKRPDASGDGEGLTRALIVFGYTQEEAHRILEPMWNSGCSRRARASSTIMSSSDSRRSRIRRLTRCASGSSCRSRRSWVPAGVSWRRAPSTRASSSSRARCSRTASWRTCARCAAFRREPCRASFPRPRGERGWNGRWSSSATTRRTTWRKAPRSSCSPTAAPIPRARRSRCSSPSAPCTRSSSAGGCGCGSA
ncbi:MAG: hypothetical protein E6H03_11790, partial [Bacillati bacterium ANGP1]